MHFELLIMLKIVTVPNNVLTAPTQPVVKVDEKIKELVIGMEETLITQIDPQGVGLAAPQVGIPLQIFIIKPELTKDTEVFINPKVLEIQEKIPSKSTAKLSKRKSSKLEGCLSIPRIWGPVKRADKIRLEYQDLTGAKKTKWFSGLKATIIMHELDHLQGVLFTQRALEQNTPLYEEKEGEFVKMNH